MKKNKILILLLLVISLFVSVLSFNATVIASTDYYSSISSSATGNTLKQSLRTLITSTHETITSYDDCKDPEILEKTDGDPENPGNIILFWSELSVDSAWASGKTYNREHVWPQNKGWFTTSLAGSDLHHIRPTDNVVNSTHNNNPYGIVSGGNYVNTSSAYNNFTTECKSGGGIFEPGDSKKGDTARIIFYLLTRYSESDSYPITNVATSMDMLLEWNILDPVDSSEVRRNNAVYDIQGNRNPFIDNSNYANMIWDEDYDPSQGGNESGGNTGEETPVVNYYPVNIDYTSSECNVVVSGTQNNNNYYTGDVTIRVTPLNGYTYSGIKDLTTGEYITTNSIYTISNINKAYNLQIVLTSTEIRKFALVTSMDEIDVGNNIIIVANEYNKAMCGTQDSNNRKDVTIEKVGYVINEVDNLQVIELKEGNIDNTYSLYTDEGYLYAASSSSNYLRSKTTLDDDGSWSINIDSNGIATIVAQGSNTRNVLRYNNSSTLFACYDANNSQKDISIYVQTEVIAEDPSIQYLNVFESQSTYTSLMMSYDVQGEMNEKTYSYTFNEKVYSSNGKQELNGVNWTLAGDGGYWGYDSTSGAHLGSGSKPYKSLTLTSETEFVSIRSISITTCGGSNTNTSFNVLVGGEVVGTQSITSSSTKYTFDVQNKNGAVSFAYTQTSSKAIYIKSINVEYGEDSSTYELLSASLRFGSYISKDIYDNLNKEDTVWGIEYFTGTNNTWDTATIKTVVCNPAQVSEPNASSIDENGLYYQFALVITNMKINHIDLTINARVFVEYEGVRYYMSDTSESLRDTANLYLAMDDKGSFKEHIGMLEYLSNYEG